MAGAPVRSSHLLPGLSCGLFVHTEHLPRSRAAVGGLDAVRDLLDEDGVGAIYTLPRRGARAAATACVAQTRVRSPEADILLDAARYSGSKRRRPASTGIDQSWLSLQHDDGLPLALTDSGFVSDGDVEGLRLILTQSEVAHRRAQARGRGVLAALPMAVSWLTDLADVLVDELNKVGTPVAVMFEHERDPLSARGAVPGLVAVLGAEVPVAVLRCDTSALGALAHGAAAVSVGDSSSTRHIPLARQGPGGGSAIPAAATLVPALLSYVHLDKIDAAIAAAPGLPLWTCDCRVCAGRRLDWIADSVEPAVAAFEHAVSALAMTARTLFADRRSIAWPTHWADAVRDAVGNHAPVAARTSSVSTWQAPAGLRAWLAHHERSGPPTVVPP
jgi:hypothetical protein